MSPKEMSPKERLNAIKQSIEAWRVVKDALIELVRRHETLVDELTQLKSAIVAKQQELQAAEDKLKIDDSV